MRRSTALLAALALGLGMIGCTKGSECDRCSSDDDCLSGFICGQLSPVNGRDVGKRCVSGIGDTECRVR
jgi:hypothetical protein